MKSTFIVLVFLVDNFSPGTYKPTDNSHILGNILEPTSAKLLRLMGIQIDTPAWLRKYGSLLIFYATILTTSAPLFFQVDDPFYQWLIVAAVIIAALVWTLVWFLLRVPPPVNRTEKFGIALLIETDSDETKQRVETDLVRGFEKTLKQENLADKFNIVVASNEQAKEYSPLLEERMSVPKQHGEGTGKDKRVDQIKRRFDRFRKKTNCEFFVWGIMVRRRDAAFKGEFGYMLQTNALVAHSNLMPHQQAKLAEQFSWMTEVNIDEKVEYTGLQFTAQELLLIAQLIIGSAAMMVGRLPAGIQLHETVYDRVKNTHGNPNHASIKRHIETMLLDGYFVSAKYAYLTEGNGAVAKECLDKSLALDARHYDSYVLLARIQFEFDGDPEAAYQTTMKSRPYAGSSGLWRYNVAFLKMFAGEYRDGLKFYNDIFLHEFPDEDFVVDQVIEFNKKHLEEGGFLPSALIIGMLLLNKKGNLPEALIYVERFIKSAPATMELLVQKAESIKMQISTKMSLND